MINIAHRAFGGKYPENTCLAVQHAAMEADSIELDLRRCRTGEVVVIHDGIVDASTNGSGRVRTLSATELRQLHVQGSSEGVPTLTSVLDIIPSEIGLVLELKEFGIAVDVLKTLHGIGRDVLITSNNVGILHEVRAVDPAVPVGLVFAADPIKHLETAQRLGCTHILPHWGVCVASDLVSRAHKADLDVYAWAVDGRFGLSMLTETGVDGVITDTPQVIENATQEPEKKSFAYWLRRGIPDRVGRLLLRSIAFTVVVLFVGGGIVLHRKTHLFLVTTTSQLVGATPLSLVGQLTQVPHGINPIGVVGSITAKAVTMVLVALSVLLPSILVMGGS